MHRSHGIVKVHLMLHLVSIISVPVSEPPSHSGSIKMFTFSLTYIWKVKESFLVGKAESICPSRESQTGKLGNFGRLQSR